MSSSTKRKAPHFSEEDTDQDTVYDADAWLAKKGKQECAFSGEGRLPATTREPDFI